MYICNLLALAGQQAIGLDPFGDPKTNARAVRLHAGMAGAIFLPGKRLNMAALLYQLMLYPLFDLAGVLSGTWF